jgi:hypothetical protein
MPPQTVNLFLEENGEDSSNKYLSAHADLSICCRDTEARTEMLPMLIAIDNIAMGWGRQLS